MIINNYFGLGDTRHLTEIEQSLHFKNFNFYRTSENHILTTKHIIECQARASEMIPLLLSTVVSNSMNEKKREELILQRLNYSETYWLAFDEYLTLTNKALSNLSRNEFVLELIKFTAVADIALNPSLPPFASNETFRKIEWDEIYPPSVFIKICLSLRQNPVSFDPFDESSVDAFYEAICNDLRKATPKELFNNLLHNHIDVLEKAELLANDFNSKEGNSSPYYNYLVGLMKKVAEWRVDSSIFHMNKGLCMVGSYSHKYIGVLLDLEEEHSWISSSPLQIKENSRTLLTPFSKKQNAIFQNVATHLIRRCLIDESIFRNQNSAVGLFPFHIPYYVRKGIVNIPLSKLHKLKIPR